MNILLLYFTGTYNTQYVTTLIKNSLISNQHKVDVAILNDKLKIKTNNYDLVGIGYPIHSFNAPKLVEKTLKNLKIKDKNYFIYKIGSNFSSKNKASSYKIYKIMKKNNNILLNEYHYLMPSNIFNKTRDDEASLEISYAIKLSKYIAKNLENKYNYKVSLPSRLISFLGKFIFPFLKLNSRFYKINKSTCIRCRTCISCCPTNNIEYNREKRRTVFKNNCISCMRCSSNCPTNSIFIGAMEKYKVSGKYDYLKLMSLSYDVDININLSKQLKSYINYVNNLIKMD